MESPGASVARGETAVTEIDSTQLELENERLQLENDKLRALGCEWWRRGTVIIALTAIVAGVWPATSAIRAGYDVERDLALETSKQRHEQAMERERQMEQVRVAFLERLKTPEDRLRALRFLLASAPDAALRSWAEAEKAALEAEPKVPRDSPTARPASVVVEKKDDQEPTPAPARPLAEPHRQRPPRSVPRPANPPVGQMALKDDPY